MKTYRERWIGGVAAVMLACGGLLTGTGDVAQAASYSVGPYKTLSACKSASRSYVSSYTKITMTCRYVPRDGGFTAAGYWFWWKPVR